MGRAVPRRIGRHTHPAARPETVSPPKRSGIDYLGLVSARVSAEERSRMGIRYSRLAAEEQANDVGSANDTTEEDSP